MIKITKEQAKQVVCMMEHKEYWEYIKTARGEIHAIYICRKCNPIEVDSEVRRGHNDPT